MNNSKYRNYILDSYGAIVMILALVFSSSLIGVIVKLSFDYFRVDIRYNEAFNILSYLFTFLPVIWAFDYFVMRRKGKVLNFNMQTRPFHVYLLIFPMMFGMMLIAEFTTSLIPISGPVFGEWYQLFSEQMEAISDNTFMVFLLVSFFAPIIEEIIFRGIIQKGMINNGVKPRNAILVSALIFGIVHFNPWQFIGAFLLGIVLGVVYFRTKSLLMSIFLHFFNNTIAAIMMKFYDTDSFAELLQIPNYLILFIGIVIFAVFYYLFMYKNRVYYRE
ncbi:lysostaphin resistance A-like protein [Cloacibacterium sp.]|uniref:CPBP family intramembrane glutamic endopeptidase n=1 Tax=Cloacibacterium sp. TaxID=1913682 RepID=UPI0039E47423